MTGNCRNGTIGTYEAISRDEERSDIVHSAPKVTVEASGQHCVETGREQEGVRPPINILVLIPHVFVMYRLVAS